MDTHRKSLNQVLVPEPWPECLGCHRMDEKIKTCRNVKFTENNMELLSTGICKMIPEHSEVRPCKLCRKLIILFDDFVLDPYGFNHRNTCEIVQRERDKIDKARKNRKGNWPARRPAKVYF